MYYLLVGASVIPARAFLFFFPPLKGYLATYLWQLPRGYLNFL